MTGALLLVLAATKENTRQRNPQRGTRRTGRTGPGDHEAEQRTGHGKNSIGHTGTAPCCDCLRTEKIEAGRAVNRRERADRTAGRARRKLDRKRRARAVVTKGNPHSKKIYRCIRAAPGSARNQAARLAREQ
jgi:hypothetical protein